METICLDEREDVQKKTFTKWINSQLVKNGKPLVRDLFEDLRDGELLLALLEILTAQQYKRERGRMRVHRVNNVNTALGVLENNGVRLVNISAADVVDGNPKLTLGLVWSVILHWQVQWHLRELMAELRHSSLEKTLLAWCRAHTQNYTGVDVRNFTTSWSDGLALNALLHRWRPQLFDYAALLARAPAQRLDHAFRLAQQHLGIARLLDPEDVNTEHPDKKSIMMYVMCLFQSLPHASEDVAALPSPTPSDPHPVDAATPAATAALPEGGWCCAEGAGGSRPVSCATSASLELGGYGAALEDVLAWLLDAEERLAAQPDSDATATTPAADQPHHELLHCLKEQFHTHERFLLELAEQQTRVGCVLEQGARLLADAQLARDEASEVRLQMRLLNQRWEALRVRAMERQARVHAALMRAQSDGLASFRQWLTETEDRISRMGECDDAGDARAARAQLAAVNALHADLRAQQPLVDALADCVVVVDADPDADPDAETDVDAGVTEIEDQLRALGERWSHTCGWTLARLRRLAARQDRLDALAARTRRLTRRADDLEAQLKQMEASPVHEVGAVVQRGEALARAAAAARRLRRAARALLDAAHDAPDAREHAEALHDRLDALHMIIDVQAQRMTELGFETNLDAIKTDEEDAESEASSESTTKTNEDRPDKEESSASMQEAMEQDSAREEAGGADAREGSSCKKPRLAAAGDAFHEESRALRDWLLSAERDLAQCWSRLEAGGAWRESRGAAERAARAAAERRARLTRLAHHEKAKEPENEKTVEELKERYEMILQRIVELRNAMNLVEEKEDICASAAQLAAVGDAGGAGDVLARAEALAARALPAAHALQLQATVEQVRRARDSTAAPVDIPSEAPMKKEEMESDVTPAEIGSKSESPAGADVGALEQRERRVRAVSERAAEVAREAGRADADHDVLLRRIDECERELNELGVEGAGVAAVRSARVLARAGALLRWLAALEARLPPPEHCAIDHSQHLYQMKARFQSLKDDCDEHTPEFRSINETGNDILVELQGGEGGEGSEGSAPSAALARALTHLNARWTQVTHGVYERYKVVCEAWLEVGELRAWLAGEAAWLDGLERRLAGEPRAPADAEELAHHLADLESYLRNHSAERLARAQAVGAQLADAHIMPAWIRAQLRQLDERSQRLRDQARTRAEELESAAKEAQRSEVALDTLQQWLQGAAAALDHAPPAPARLQELRAEAGRMREVAREADEHADAYERAHRRAAAARLRDQLALLKNKLDEVESRLSEAAEPPREDEVAARLAAAAAKLRGVRAAAGDALQPPPPDPERVRARLRHCLRLYRTLSELKGEVEGCIRAGRRAAAAAPAPQALSRQVDELKELYNQLGAQVTEAKNKLERALVSARELQSDLQTLRAWLSSRGASAGAGGAGTLELEMSRMAAARDQLNASLARFAADADADDPQLNDIRKQVEEVNTAWEQLKKQRASHVTETASATRAPDAQMRDAQDGPAEYEAVTDTIKRRLESPARSPERDRDRPDLKKSRIPLALRSPAPIRRGVKEGGARARRPPSPATAAFDSLNDSNDSETTITREDAAVDNENDAEADKSDYHVVEVKEHEIVKATVSPAEVEDGETAAENSPQLAPALGALGDAPRTFVVEVRTLEQRRRPTRGIVARASPSPPRRSAAAGASTGLRREPVNEYLILDEVPLETPALPEPSATPRAASPPAPEHLDSHESIYSEVEESPTSQKEELASAGEEHEPAPAEGPLCTSTPLRGAAVVAAQPKPPSEPVTPSPTPQLDQTQSEVAESEEQSQGDTQGEGWGARVAAALAGDAELAQFAAAAHAMARRLDVALLTVAAVGSERDPAKRREILKSQVGGAAPDAAELISRGDSLVFARHRADPLLADYLQAQVTDRLRARWAAVAAEVEARREAAARAERQLTALERLLRALHAATARAHDSADCTCTPSQRAEVEDLAAQLQELSAELRAARVRVPERAVATANERARLHTAAPAGKHCAESGVGGVELRAAAFIARAGGTRGVLNALVRDLRAPPLGAKDYDDFPHQEDALQKIKSSLEEATAAVNELEREYQWLSARARGDTGERVRRAIETLRAERDELSEDYKRRHERWAQCQAVWARLYAALEAAGEWLDAAERARISQTDHQMARMGEVVGRARASGRAVAGACGGALAADVRDQLDALNERWHSFRTDRAKLSQHETECNISAETSDVGDEEGAAAAERALREARDLLATSANPADRTSLAIRLSLVKAREEEVAARARDMEALRAAAGTDTPLSRAEQARAERLARDLDQAAARLAAHGAYVGARLAALSALAERLATLAPWLTDVRARLAAGDDAELAAAVGARAGEVRDVLERGGELERACAAAEQPLVGELRARLARLHDDWAAVCDRPARAAPISPLPDRIVQEHTTERAAQPEPRGAPAASDAPAELDASVLQIREWLAAEMLRAPSVAVGDAAAVRAQLDRQQGLLRELEQKKPQLDELLHTAETLRGSENRQHLHGKVTALRSHWEEANARVLQRKAQLDAMLGDSTRYEARRRDADAWLARMEARLAAMPPPAHTADVLDLQMREQKSFHAEVHQYKHQIELFGQLTQRLIAVYRSDDTSRVKRATEAINHRYSELNNSIVARGKALHSAVSSLQNFDRSLEQFLGWLSEAESLLDAADREPQLFKPQFTGLYTFTRYKKNQKYKLHAKSLGSQQSIAERWRRLNSTSRMNSLKKYVNAGLASSLRPITIEKIF